MSTPLSNKRLKHLFDGFNDGPVLRVPFVVESRPVDPLFHWGRSRPLPHLGHFDPSLGRNVTPEDLLAAATRPPKECMTMVVVGPDQVEHNVYITPMQGNTFVSVHDVLQAIQTVIHAAESQVPAGMLGHYSHGDSLSRAPNGTWGWKGLSEMRNETDAWRL